MGDLYITISKFINGHAIILWLDNKKVIKINT